MSADRVAEGFADFRGHRTWYRVTGSLDAAKRPVVILHGGPGGGHDYTEAFKGLAQRGRAVIHYDQLGCGRSTHLPDKGVDFWTVQLFLDELANLLRVLGIAGAYHVVGQSWGGMLGAEHGVTRPAGLRSLTIADSPASMKLWVEEADRLRALLPPEVQATLLRHEAAGTTSAPEYTTAVRVFYDRHLCRIPWPDELTRSFAVPTLLISGRHDEATPATVQPYADRIKDVRWEIFENSAHLPHIEETARCLQVVGDFLDAHDR